MPQATAFDALTTNFRSANLTASESVDAIKAVAADLPDDKKKELARSLLLGLEPTQPTVNKLYLLVIGALILILLGAASVLIGVFTPTNTAVTMDRVLGIFTTVLSFIIGLFVPSPTQKP
jgi:hypothetical protein